MRRGTSLPPTLVLHLAAALMFVTALSGAAGAAAKPLVLAGFALVAVSLVPGLRPR